MKSLIRRILPTRLPDPVAAFIERVGLAGRTGGPTQAWDPVSVLAGELGRARRYERDLSVAVVATGPQRNGREPRADAPQPTIETAVPHMLSLLAAAALRDVLRETDVICYDAARNRLVIGLIESDDEEALCAVRRIGELLAARFRLRVTSGVALFPEDGLTLDDLVAQATSRAERPRAGSARGSGPAIEGEPGAAESETHRDVPTPAAGD